MNVRMDSEDGLSEIEASVRLRQYGPNEIREEPSGMLRGVLKRFWGPLPWMSSARRSSRRSSVAYCCSVPSSGARRSAAPTRLWTCFAAACE